MRIEQGVWTMPRGWPLPRTGGLSGEADLVLAFGEGELLAGAYEGLREAYPGATLLGCSTAGEILGSEVREGSVAATAISFESARVRGARARSAGPGNSEAAGASIAERLRGEGLAHVFVLSDGLAINGGDMIRGLVAGLPRGVGITGGLAADGPRFKRTSVFLDSPPESGEVVAAGLYGDRLEVGYGSFGGWDPFGVEWEITRSEGPVLFELDGQPALDLYKLFLGDHASGLPATGLLFPLSIRAEGATEPLVRTLLAVDEAAGSLTFAGDLPRGAYARFMKANIDRLVEGAARAARDGALALGPGSGSGTELAILISCVGRKLVLKQRVEEEVEAVAAALGPGAAMTGFYSYGELAPFGPSKPCELHNQTMTITVLRER